MTRPFPSLPFPLVAVSWRRGRRKEFRGARGKGGRKGFSGERGREGKGGGGEGIQKKEGMGEGKREGFGGVPERGRGVQRGEGTVEGGQEGRWGREGGGLVSPVPLGKKKSFISSERLGGHTAFSATVPSEYIGPISSVIFIAGRCELRLDYY